MSILRQQIRKSLAYPGGRPGFNSGHVAGSGVIASLVAAPGVGQFNNIFSGGAGTLVSSPTAAIHGIIGPSVVGTSGAGIGVIFSGYATGIGSVPFTLACIATAPASFAAGAQAMIGFGASADNAGFYLRTAQTTGVLVASCPAGTTQTSALALVINVPYFVVISNAPGVVVNYLAKRLDTGQIFTATTAACAPINGNGVITLLQESGRGWGGAISHAMVSLSHMPMSALQQWATDPWGFWYPYSNYGSIDIGAIIAAGGFKAAWAQQNNYPVIGTGIY